MIWKIIIAIVVVCAAILATTSCSFGPKPKLPPLDKTSAASAWRAWRSGDFSKAGKIAEELITKGESGDEARHVLALSQHMLGEHDAAISTHRQIDPDYEHLAALDEPILWSFIHRGDLKGARLFADLRGLLRDKRIRKRLDMHSEHPLRVEANGLSILPFTKDDFSPFMPGFEVKLNSRATVARLDTGGPWVVIPTELTEHFGVETVTCEGAFAALSEGETCYGVADLEIGNARLINVPVEVISHLSEDKKMIAELYGVDIGVFIGTNVLRHFLATVDSPGQRLILSKRGDEIAHQEHLALLPQRKHRQSFGIWQKHLLVAKGRYGDESERVFFIDSGLTAATEEDGQAALLVPQSQADSWDLQPVPPGRLTPLTKSFALGNASRSGLYAFIVPDKTWKNFGNWGGVNVEALASYSYLKHYAWTLDFDNRTIWLMKPNQT